MISNEDYASWLLEIRPSGTDLAPQWLFLSWEKSSTRSSLMPLPPSWDELLTPLLSKTFFSLIHLGQAQCLQQKCSKKDRSCPSSNLTCPGLELLAGGDGAPGGVPRSGAVLHNPAGNPSPSPCAVADQLSANSSPRGFLLLLGPFHKQPDRKPTTWRQTDRQTFPDLHWCLTRQPSTGGARSAQHLGLGAFARSGPGLPSSRHKSSAATEPVDTFKSAGKMSGGDRS